MKLQPYILRDFSRGRIIPSAVSDSLRPENSVSDSINVNFDTIIGSAVVRYGTTLFGATVASGKTPLGLTNYATANLVTNLVVGVFSGASTASIYYYDTSWHTSAVTNLDNTAKNRFASLGGRIFRVNGVTAMASSTNGNTWGTTNCLGLTTPHIVGLVFRQKNRLLAGADTVFPSRVWFSGIIDPGAATTLTWNEGNTGGDFIDINPDDDGGLTAFAETSSVALVFKPNSMYRLDVVSKSVDTENIFDVGAVSQEAVTRCQGVVYFFSGKDIRMTDGGFPKQISRLGVQDFVDAIPQSSWANVGAGADDWNVYFSIGNITLNTGKDNQKAYSNVVLKFSVRDQAWSVHSYKDQQRFYVKHTTTANGKTLLEADTSGNVQTINLGTTDNQTPIFYSLTSQDLEFSVRQNVKEISNTITVFTQNGGNSRMQLSTDGKKPKDIPGDLTDRVNTLRNINARGNFFNFIWSGENSGTLPVFEGFSVNDINDDGTN